MAKQNILVIEDYKDISRLVQHGSIGLCDDHFRKRSWCY